MTVLFLAVLAGTIVAGQPASAATRRADGLADAASVALGALAQRQQVRQAVLDEVLTGDDPFVVATEKRFADARWTVAALAAPRGGVDAVALNSVWARTEERRMVAVLAALSQVGVPYRRNRSEPGVGFDCSGLTAFAWGAAGVTLARNSSSQINAAASRPLAEVQPGDLVQYPGHVMLALGLGDAMVHAPYTGRTVEVKPWSRARRAGSPI
jgi:cell wall-associated NlpC family hydrolase